METARRPVRPASRDDLPALVALMREFYAEAGFELADSKAAGAFEALLRNRGRGRIWLMEEDGEPAGYVVLTVAFSMEYGTLRGFVDDLFVRSRFRRRGHAGRALQAVTDACVEDGVRALAVEVGPDNDAAQSAYRRAGFGAVGRQLLVRELGEPLHER